MKSLLVLLGLVAVVFGEGCGPLQRLKVKSQWAHVYKYGKDREHFGIEVWKDFFNHEDKAKELFAGVNVDNIYSAEFKAHISRVMGGIDMCISLLDEPAVLDAALAHLNGQHKERGIPAEYFVSFGAALMRVVPNELGTHFDKGAWLSCFNVIADGINKA